jgi:dihydromethanopterin reductase (acceptor)
MVTQIAWAITGAGHFLQETFDVMDKLVKSNKATVTTFLSSAGEQVVKMYGLRNKLEQISPGAYLQEIFTENKNDPGCLHSGRFILDLYSVLVVSPASGNTVAKIAHGIADTLVTNAVAQAQKANVPVYVVPTDQKEGSIETVLPCRVDRTICKQCEPCAVVKSCSFSTVTLVDGIPKIDSVLCQGCGMCVTSCQFGAVKCGEKKKMLIRSVDVQIVNKLQSMNNMTVLEHPKQIETFVTKF